MRVECPHAARCAGCPAIDRTIAEQLEHKRARLREALGRYPSLGELDVEAPSTADPIVGYRTRAKLVVGPRGELGLFAKGEDHIVVDIPECRVIAPSLAAVAAAIREEIGGGAGLRAVDLREVVAPDGVTSALVTLIFARDVGADDLARRIAERTFASVAVSFSGDASPQLLGRDLRVVRGGELRDRIDESTWTYAAHGAFVQAHRAEAVRLYHEVRDRLAAALGDLRGLRIVDAYAGSGAIGLVLAKAGARVLAVESFVPASERAARAAEEQGLAIRAVAADATEEIARRAEHGERVDAIVLDPPRRGVPASLRLACAALEPSAIAMVSCEPATFARDLDHFARLGYRARTARPFDLMPLTDEVEALAILERASPIAPRVLYRDERLVALEKSAHEPTTPQEGRVRSLLERARATLPGLERAVPLHRLDVGTSGVCLFATSPEHAGALASSMHDKRYVALARGIARPKGTIRRPLRIDGEMREARTRYERARVVHGHSLLNVRIDTGRTHQIRRHLAMIGHPVLGDDRYGDAASNRHFANKHGLDRPFLHCARMSIGEIAIEAPLPGELAAIVEAH